VVHTVRVSYSQASARTSPRVRVIKDMASSQCLWHSAAVRGVGDENGFLTYRCGHDNGASRDSAGLSFPRPLQPLDLPTASGFAGLPVAATGGLVKFYKSRISRTACLPAPAAPIAQVAPPNVVQETQIVARQRLKARNGSRSGYVCPSIFDHAERSLSSRLGAI
jgi:hypothetical protein